MILPEKMLTPEDEELVRKKASLAELEARLADRELELASYLADLAHFENLYLQSVGRRYAILDELNARLAEARARQNPRSQDAREQARQARSQAQESARAAGEENAGATALDVQASFSKPKRPESLRDLYRKAAKLLHPDLTLDPPGPGRAEKAASSDGQGKRCVPTGRRGTDSGHPSGMAHVT